MHKVSERDNSVKKIHLKEDKSESKEKLIKEIKNAKVLKISNKKSKTSQKVHQNSVKHTTPQNSLNINTDKIIKSVQKKTKSNPKSTPHSLKEKKKSLSKPK